MSYDRTIIDSLELTHIYYKNGREWHRHTHEYWIYNSNVYNDYKTGGTGYLNYGKFPAGKFDVAIYSDGVLVALSSFIVE